MEFDYPLPVTRKMWRVKCGGYSEELPKNTAGINKKALEEKNLPLKAKVEVRDYQTQISYTSSICKLYPLDDATPSALRKSENGQIILPEESKSIVRRPQGYTRLGKGKSLVIKVLKRL